MRRGLVTITIAVVARGGRLACVPVRVGAHRPEFFRLRAKEHCPQSSQGDLLAFDRLGQPDKLVEYRLERGVVFLVQDRLRPFEQRFDLSEIDVHRGRRLRHSMAINAFRNCFVSGYPMTCLSDRLDLCVRSSLPRPVVVPSSIQLAAL